MVYYCDSTKTVHDDASGEDREQGFRFLKTYTVFNVAQIDGWPERFHIAPEPSPEVERIEAAEAFFASIPATVNHSGDRAYYIPSADRIQLPSFAAFHDAHSYYATRGMRPCTELAMRARLDRSFGREKWGDEGTRGRNWWQNWAPPFLPQISGFASSRPPTMPAIRKLDQGAAKRHPRHRESRRPCRTRRCLCTNWRTRIRRRGRRNYLCLGRPK